MANGRLVLPTLLLSVALAGTLAFLAGRPDELRARTAESQNRGPEAVVSYVSGDVQVRVGSGPWRPALRGQLLKANAAVRTGPDGRAELTLRSRPGRLRLDRSTVFVLERDGLAVAGRVDSGSVWSQLQAGGRDMPPFGLSAGKVETRASEAVFRVHAVRADSVRVAVYHGRAAVHRTAAADGEWPATGQSLLGGQALAVGGGGRYWLEAVGPDEDWQDGWRHPAGQARPENDAAEGPEPAPRVASLREELTDISPDVYVSVQLEMKGAPGQPEDFQPDQVQIRRIRIRSRQWDRLAPARKVELLNDTFSLLKGKYPNMLHSVVLEFDDGRPALALKYGSPVAG